MPDPAVPRAHVRSPAAMWRDVAIVVGMLVAVTLLHLWASDAGASPALHLLYRRLYYAPILYAAFVFGPRGGIAAAVVATIPFGLHSHLQLDRFFTTQADNALEIAMFVVVGLLFGWLRDLEERRTEDLRQVGRQLEDAYGKLEERAIQLINIQDYTQSILRSITSGVITVGPDGSVATVNPAAERILGMSEFEVVPRVIGSVFKDDAGLGRDVAKILEGRLPRLMRDLTLVTGTGRTVHAQVSASRMRAVGGRILGAVVTVEDVSEVRALTDQLIRSDRLAALGELTAGVAHEVRNPLGVIRASVQLLEDARSDPARVREATNVIKQEIDRLDRVIKALLDFGRPSPPTMAPVDVEEVLEDVMMFTRKFAGHAEVRITKRFAGGLPLVLGDPDQLKQVFLNLVTNAVQAMEETGGVITLSTWADDGFVAVEVADTGPGVPLEDVDKIFDPFYSRREDGTGLGLTIVHRILDGHEGHIEAESRPGQGMRFTVSLPAMQDREGVEEMR